MGTERFKVLLLAAGAAVSFACAASEKSDIYKAFLTTNAATRRAWMDDADMRKRMSRLGTPPAGAPEFGVPQWYVAHGIGAVLRVEPSLRWRDADLAAPHSSLTSLPIP